MTDRVWAVVVTYRRPSALARTLDALRGQDVAFERVVVVDDDPEHSARPVADGLPTGAYIGHGVNAGPAEARATGIRRVLSDAAANDWIALFDDDDPLPRRDVVSGVLRFAEAQVRADDRTAAVGVHGGRLSGLLGRVRSVMGTDGPDAVAVDSLSAGWYSLYRAAPLREVGSFFGPLFFGWEELELGLRLRAAGYSLYASRRLYRSLAPLRQDPGDRAPSPRLDDPGVRRYYDIRNMAFILRRFRRPFALASMIATIGVLKPVASMWAEPARARAHLRLGARAIRDGIAGRLGPAPADLVRATPSERSP